MRINQIKYFVSVFDLHSFSDAAKAEGVTVQAVSKAIGDLERSAGTKLFERTARGVVPTAAGVALCEEARPVKEAFVQLEGFIARMHLTQGQEAPAASVAEPPVARPLKVQLVAPDYEGNGVFCGDFQKMISDACGFDVDFSLEYPSRAIADLESGKVDALVTIGRYDRPGLTCAELGALPTVIIVGRDHPLATRPSASMADLSAYPAGMSPEFDGFNESVLVMYREKGLLGTIETINSQKDLVRFMWGRKGYCFNAKIPVPSNPASPVVEVPIDPVSALRAPVCLLTRLGEGEQDSRLAVVEAFFIDLVAGASATPTFDE